MPPTTFHVVINVQDGSYALGVPKFRVWANEALDTTAFLVHIEQASQH